MKNNLLTIIFLGLVHVVFAQNILTQEAIPDTLSTFEIDSVSLSNAGIYLGLEQMQMQIVDRSYDCTPWENYSDWEMVIGQHDKKTGLSICIHEWVYAKYKDVNPQTGTTTMVYCPCGCPQYENEARICRKCKRHEKRTHSWGFTYEPHESEYKKLLKEIEKN